MLCKSTHQNELGTSRTCVWRCPMDIVRIVPYCDSCPTQRYSFLSQQSSYRNNSFMKEDTYECILSSFTSSSFSSCSLPVLHASTSFPYPCVPSSTFQPSTYSQSCHPYFSHENFRSHVVSCADCQPWLVSGQCHVASYRRDGRPF